MNLLPKSHKEFSQKDYWENFFKKRGNKAFEWYGEYPELCGHLHKYIKVKDDVLVVGCGNSSLSRDLYDLGYTKITNIDISQVVIRQMLNLHQKTRPDLKYIQMDVFNMSFDDASFTVVLDKGTLDALLPDNKTETVKNIHQYFSEIERILKIGGRYVCISLLQKHILDLILAYFPQHNWMFRVVRCFDAENKDEDGSSLPVFMVICTKFKSLPKMILEINLGSIDKMQRLERLEDVTQMISGVQQASFICSGLKKGSITDELSFDLCMPGNDIPRFTIYVVDIPPDPKNSMYAAFIVPQGREVEWMFSTNKGRKHLAQITNHNRLAIITLHREHDYESLESIQSELNYSVCQFAPAGGPRKIHFLSLGDDVGSRIIRCKGTSENSGDYVIEDVEIESASKYRRLVYMNSQSIVQSEAKLKTIKSRNGSEKEIVDHTFLTCGHHLYMSVGACVAISNKATPSVAIIGLGGGGLCMFLRKFLPNVNINAVDIDKEMLQVAKNWFGLKLDEKLHVQILDGIEFLKNSAENGKKFDAILFDVDSKDQSIGMSCPPKQFLEYSTLDNVVKCLNKTGFFILNLVLRDSSLHPQIMNDLKGKFSTIASHPLKTDLNEIIMCTSEKLKGSSLNTKLREACQKVNEFYECNHRQKNDPVEKLEFEELFENLHIIGND